MTGTSWLTARPVAHRGLHDPACHIVENTPSAFTAAIAGGYAIECDVQVSSDGEAMVHHDDALGRLTDGSARLDSMTAAALRQVRFKETSDRMMAIGELCDLVGGRVALFIELKSRFDSDVRLVKRAGAVLGAYSGPAALMSFDPGPIAALRSIAPKIVRGIVAERRKKPQTERGPGTMRYARDALNARPCFIAYCVKDLPAAIPFVTRSVFGLPLLAWTVRSSEDVKRAARWADQIIFEGIRP
jgi:glycerophosphoryl diester phosphodiesterase